MPETSDVEIESPKSSMQLESIDRITNMPYISSTINLTTGLYGKMKEASVASRLILESAEHSVQKVVALVEPVVTTLEKPIKIADSVVCSTIDLVGESIPKVMEAPNKISSVMPSVPVQPAVEYVRAVGSYGVQKVNHLYGQLHSQNTQDDETVRETEPEKYDQETLIESNVRSKVKMFSQK